MKKKYRIVKEWKTRYNLKTNKTEGVDWPTYYIEYHDIWTLFRTGHAWERAFLYRDGFETEQAAREALGELLKLQEKTTTHKEIVFRSK